MFMDSSTAPFLEKTSYAGWAQAVRLRRGEWELVAPLEIGPRILRLGPTGGANIFYEDTAQLGKAGGDTWKIYGGHRLWTAPESEPSYAPDNEPVEFHPVATDGFRLTGRPHPKFGWQKELEIRWQPDGLIRVEHRLTNRRAETLSAVPWCLTVLAAHGTALVPQPAHSPHPSELPQGQSFSMEEYLPSRTLALWKFTDLADPRLRLGRSLWSLHQRSGAPAFKIGFRHTEGWIGYRREDLFFSKWIPHDPAARYPDRDSNAELFTNGNILEVESLAPDRPLAGHETVIHTEWWHITRVAFPTQDESAALRHFHTLPRPTA